MKRMMDDGNEYKSSDMFENSERHMSKLSQTGTKFSQKLRLMNYKPYHRSAASFYVNVDFIAPNSLNAFAVPPCG